MLLMSTVVAAVVFVERGQYQVPIRFPKRVTAGGAASGGQNTHLPLKVNVAGVIPPIFASSIMFFSCYDLLAVSRKCILSIFYHRFSFQEHGHTM